VQEATSTRRPRRDIMMPVAVGLITFAIAALFNFEEHWHAFAVKYQEQFQFDALPFAMLAAGIVAAGFAWRRLRTYAQAAEEKHAVNNLLSAQLERNEKLIADLITARQNAVDLDRAKTRFLAHMSHELRTPLNAIVGFSELMQMETFGPVGHAHYADYVSSIHESGQQLSDMIGNLLDLARLETGDLTPKIERCTLGELADDASKILAVRAREAGIDLRHTATPQAAFEAHIDCGLIRHVLINLISNSIRHTPAGGFIEVKAIVKPSGMFGFAVADSGTGMDSDMATRATDGLGDVDTVLRRDHHGAGTGLPISRAILNAHGGKLEIDSAPGTGTRIEVLLPAECAAPQPSASQSPSPQSPSEPGGPSA